MTPSFIRWAGVALGVSAITTLAINVLVSPRLPVGPFATVASSDTYFVRQCLASVVALLLVFGIVGIRAAGLVRAGIFGSVAFVTALTGQVALFAVEYGQAFTIHDYALQAPESLNHTMADPSGTLIIGALIGISLFYLGWFLLALALILSRNAPRWGGWLILGGFVLTPGLSLMKSLGVLGGIVSSLIIGTGWFLTGLQMIREPSTRQ